MLTVITKRNGVSEAPIYAWQKRSGEMKPNDIKRLKEHEVENSHLKGLLAERDLAINAMKEIAAKNGKRAGQSIWINHTGFTKSIGITQGFPINDGAKIETVEEQEEDLVGLLHA